MASTLKAAVIHDGEPDPETGEIKTRAEAETVGEPLGDEVAVETIDLASETLSGDLRDAVLDLFKNRQKPWQELGERDKIDVAEHVEAMTRNLVTRACLMLAAGGRITAPAELETYQQKGREVVAKLNLFASPEAILALNKACGSTVQIVFVDAAPFKGERSAVEIEKDQPALFDQTPHGQAD